MTTNRPEPWLRGTHTHVDALRRQVVHALELTAEDAERWVPGLTQAELDDRPFGLASAAFHLRHIAGSLDRLLTYAEGAELTPAQLDALRTEMDSGEPTASLLDEFQRALDLAAVRVLAIAPGTFEQTRRVGRAALPSTVGGLLVHCAEHTQRHAGQLVTTARVLIGLRASRP